MYWTSASFRGLVWDAYLTVLYSLVQVISKIQQAILLSHRLIRTPFSRKSSQWQVVRLIQQMCACNEVGTTFRASPSMGADCIKSPFLSYLYFCPEITTVHDAWR